MVVEIQVVVGFPKKWWLEFKCRESGRDEWWLGEQVQRE
jgi:hypothetical protein